MQLEGRRNPSKSKRLSFCHLDLCWVITTIYPRGQGKNRLGIITCLKYAMPVFQDVLLVNFKKGSLLSGFAPEFLWFSNCNCKISLDFSSKFDFIFVLILRKNFSSKYKALPDCRQQKKNLLWDHHRLPYPFWNPLQFLELDSSWFFKCTNTWTLLTIE